jgi:[ribosomal protein S18]-alanine N-acetyltransferase
VEIRPLTSDDAQRITTWRYPDRYSTYDVNEVIYAAKGYWSVYDDDELVGYCCFGFEARVPGVEEEAGTIDIGYGMRPDLVGKGLGRSFLGAILEFAESTFSERSHRLLILDWNGRSRALAERMGFEEKAAVVSHEGIFVILRRDISEKIP